MKKINGKRFSKRRKGEIVLRLIRGESLEELSRETGRPAYELAKWRDQFLDGGYTTFSEPGKEAEDLLERYKSLLGEQSMENELLREKIKRLEGDSPFRLRRSKK